MKKLIMVIGGTASGKTTFIKKQFADHEGVSCLNVWDYQDRAYKEAGYLESIPFGASFRCLMKANNELLQDMIEKMKDGDVVIEQTFFKAKRRIAYIDAVKEQYPDVQIVVYVMSPDDNLWESNCEKRKLGSAFINYKRQIEEDFEFPNPAEGFDAIYTVRDDKIALRMDSPLIDIVKKAREELVEESERISREENAKQKRKELLESMKTRPFWHYCEVCGKKEYLTAQEADGSGWDYPPSFGSFGMLGQRKCGDCGIDKTLWWRITTTQKLPIVFEESLSKSELRTWRRIKEEPESLLEDEDTKVNS